MNEAGSKYCPECGAPIREKTLKEGGGICCTSPECDWWFCY